MKTLQKKCLVVATASLITAPVLAESYIGGNLGQTDYQEGEEQLSWEFIGGFKFHEYLGVELFYLDLGKNEIEDPIDLALVEYQFSGWGAALRAELPLLQTLNLYSRIGFYDWDADVTVTLDGFEETGSLDDRDLRYGFGLAWNVAENAKVSFGYDAFEFDFSSSDDVENLNIGVIFSF